MDFDALSVDATKKAERDAEIEKRKHSREIAAEAKTAGEGGGVSFAQLQARVSAAIAEKRKRGRPPKEPVSSEESQGQRQQDADAGRVRHAELFARYTRYAQSRNPQIQAAVAGVEPNPRWSTEELQMQLDRVRAALNSSGAEDIVKRGVVTAAQAAEWVTMKAGINPTNEDLTEFGAVMEEMLLGPDADPNLLQPELSEMQAEVGSLLYVSWPTRLTMKLCHAIRSYTLARRERYGTQASKRARVDYPVSVEEQKKPEAAPPLPEK